MKFKKEIQIFRSMIILILCLFQARNRAKKNKKKASKSSKEEAETEAQMLNRLALEVSFFIEFSLKKIKGFLCNSPKFFLYLKIIILKKTMY